MKHLSIAVLLLIFFPARFIGQTTITNFGMGNTPVFTTNNFKCIGVGKGNIIWAGTQYGGLYMFDNTFNVWRKSDKLTNVFINDIKPDADSGIWIAQSGQTSVGGNSNIAGGVNYFPAASDISMNFYSVLGTTTSADLLSRNVRSLYVDKSFGSANTTLPRVWAAQGTYITSFNTKRGGLSAGLNTYSPYFNNYAGGYATGTTATPVSEAIGGNSEEVWVAARMNNGGSQILSYTPSGTFKRTYSTADTSLLQPGFTAQAIHFDALGNRWIGMKANGLVVKTPDGWQGLNTASFFPSGTQVNYNAITSDEFGNVYIGTSNGLLEYQSKDYNPSSSPGYAPSYNHYTTNEGLPSDNITGLAYDQKNGRVLITSDAGVTFMNKRQAFIKGVVFDVFCNLDDTAKKYSGLQKIPLNAGVTVQLIKNNVIEEFATPDANGIFELKMANDTDRYTVQVRFIRNGKTMLYRYHDVRNHTLMQPILFPDSLIKEVNAFKSKLEKRCFPVKLYFGIEVAPQFLCTDAFGSGNVFNMSSYEDAYSLFYDPQGLERDQKRRVDNLAIYYTSLAAVYNMGGSGTDLVTDATANLFDAVEALKSFFEFGSSLKKAPDSSLSALGEADFAGRMAAVKFLKDGVIMGLSKVASLIPDPETKAMVDKTLSSFNEIVDVVFEAAENGRNMAIIKVILDNLKKVVAVGLAVDWYKENYATDRHKYFIPTASLSAYANQSEHTYDNDFNVIYNPANNSLVKMSNDELKSRKDNLETLASIAKYSDMASNALDAANALVILTGGQAAAIVKGLSFTAKGIKAGAMVAGVYQGAMGAHNIAALSDSILLKGDLNRPVANPVNTITNVLVNTPDSLIARKNRYNQRLTELQAIYLANYDSATYRNKRKQFRVEDSLYSVSLLGTLNEIYANADSASNRIPGFSSRIDRVVDSFVQLQYALRHALFLQNISYILAADKSSYAPGLDSLANQLKLANDSAVNGIALLVSSINEAGIGAQAYLVQEGYQINHSRLPGSSGTITYTFKNYGGVTQNNVSFKISKPTAGYTITSADSINVGNILPGQTKQVSYTFLSPQHDSLGHYMIDVKAANGRYKDVYGDFYVLDPTKFYSVQDGDWNNPSTWNLNAVPGAANSVVVTHKVTVTADASCKSVMANRPGNITVNAGKKFIITH